MKIDDWRPAQFSIKANILGMETILYVAGYSYGVFGLVDPKCPSTGEIPLEGEKALIFIPTGKSLYPELRSPLSWTAMISQWEAVIPGIKEIRSLKKIGRKVRKISQKHISFNIDEGSVDPMDR